MCEIKNKKLRIKNMKQMVLTNEQSVRSDIENMDNEESDIERGHSEEDSNDVVSGSKSVQVSSTVEMEDFHDKDPSTELRQNSGQEQVINEVTDTADLESTRNEENQAKFQKLYPCPKCGKKYAKKPYSVKHCQAKPLWKCSLCGIEIKQAGNVKRHQKSCSKRVNQELPVKVVKTFMCDECDEEFGTIFNLLRHRRKMHHVILFNKFVCQVSQCPFTTAKEIQLKIHFKKAHSHKDINCSQCDYVCSSISGLRKHMINVHGVDCKFCAKLFSSDKKLEAHVNIFHKGLTSDNPDEIVVSRRIGEHAQYNIPAEANGKEDDVADIDNNVQVIS